MMLGTQPHDDEHQLRTLQWVVVAFSCLFVFVIWNGYYHLFANRGLLFAIFGGLLLSAIAWGLGKFIGSSKKRLKGTGNAPLFVLMLTLSAVGVFNSLMINLEGRRIFQETIDNGLKDWLELQHVADESLQDQKIEAKRERIANLKLALKQEIENEFNCGAGPAARKIMDEVKQELPGFTVLSGSPVTVCADSSKVASMYMEQIDSLEKQYIEKHGYLNLIAERERTLSAITQSKIELLKLQREVDSGVDLLNETRPRLEELAANYRSLALMLYMFPAGKALANSMDISAVRNLGEWSQAINLIVSRLDKLQTYVYIFLAVFADWLLVHLFGMLRQIRGDIPPAKVESEPTIANPWAGS
jgi:hypothetical protein